MEINVPHVSNACDALEWIKFLQKVENMMPKTNEYNKGFRDAFHCLQMMFSGAIKQVRHGSN